MSLPRDVETLKVEGNALYVAGDHIGAIKKYTAAINVASDNTILFANRAACHIALKQFVHFSIFFLFPPLTPIVSGMNGPSKTRKRYTSVTKFRSYYTFLTPFVSGDRIGSQIC